MAARSVDADVRDMRRNMDDPSRDVNAGRDARLTIRDEVLDAALNCRDTPMGWGGT